LEILKNILEELKISNEEDLRNYINENYGKDSKLKILKATDLSVDSENRIINEAIEHNYVIIDVPMLDISNSSKIRFQDCIFTGDLRIGNRERKDLNVFFNHVCINGYLSISGACCTNGLSLNSVMAKEIRVINSEVQKFNLTTCRMSSFKIHNATIDDFSAFFNEIGYLETYKSKFLSIDFSNEQVDIKNQTLKKDALDKIYQEFNCLEYHDDLDFDALSVSEKKLATSETLEFLSENASSKVDRKTYSEIKYQAGLNNIDSKLKKTIYQVFGGLIKPKYIFTLMLLTIFLFGLVFSYFGVFNAPCLNGLETCDVRGLSFLEALYYSGITFTTIGYGDIYPDKFIGYIAILEGVLGVFLSSCLVISLTRRYIE